MIPDTQQHTTTAGIANSSARILPEYTVCLSRTASVGYVLVMGRPMATSQDFVNWVCGGELDWRWLKYVLQSEKAALLRFASGTTHQTIYFPEVKAFHILLPPPDEQTRICDVLGALDDKIESNRRLAAVLDETAAALFRARFVDFVGVGDLVESEIGPIPCGWTVRPIGTVVRTVGGATPSTKVSDFWEGGAHAWATPKDLASLRFLPLLRTARRLTDRGLAKVSSGLLPPGSVLLSSRAPIGYVAIAEVPTAINQGFIAMICDGELPNHYVVQWIRANMDRIKGAANGTTFPEISKASFRPLPILVPPPDVVGEFQTAAGSLYRRVVGCVRESAILAELRDTLLPKLVSGQIRVREAEEMVESM